MKSKIFRVVTALVTASMLISAAGTPAAVAQGTVPPRSINTSKLEQLQPTEIKSLTGRYTILFEEDSLVMNLAKTEGSSSIKVDANDAYLTQLRTAQNEKVSQISSELKHEVTIEQRFDVILNGVTVSLSAQEAAYVASLPGVKNVIPETINHIDTDAGPEWINADEIWNDTAVPGDNMETQGEGILVGILDTGINFDHPSFAETAVGDSYVYPVTDPVGVCDSADPAYDADYAGRCNNKLIGAYSFVTESMSPEDSDGHGSHTASTVAGNHLSIVENGASLNISGVAPHAQIIAYDVCQPGGCSSISSTAAVQQAILNGVDVINYSISGGTDPYNDTVELAFLEAAEAGIFVATSGGNRESEPTTDGYVNHLSPWVTTVAASSHDRDFFNTITNFSANAISDINGKGLSESVSGTIVFADDYSSNALCAPSVWSAATFTSGQIVLCDRGNYALVDKIAAVKDAGAGGVIIRNVPSGATSLPTLSFDLPGTMINSADGITLKTWMDANVGATVTITAAVGIHDDAYGDIKADFSFRGPGTNDFEILKPEVTAPGLRIIAAVADGVIADDSVAEYDMYQGTSMSSPHVAGSAALMKALHPTWTPFEIKSALMMSSKTTNLLKEDETTPADAFDFGAGRVDLSAAAKAGLVLNETGTNFESANPADNGDVTTLNIASMQNNACVGSCSWTRTFTNVADVSAQYARTDLTAWLDVSPTSFTLNPGETETVTFTANTDTMVVDEWTFGSVVFESTETFTTGESISAAHLPIAVMASNGNLPKSVAKDIYRDSGAVILSDLLATEITDLSTTVYGLVKAVPQTISLVPDATNSEVYDDLDQVFYTTFEVTPGTKRIVAEILDTTASDLDMFWGVDDNSDGMPEEAEEIGRSATGVALEYLSLMDPDPDTYWLLIQNWDGTATGDDIIYALTQISGLAEGNLTIEGPTSNPAVTPFSLTLNYTEDTEVGDRLYGVFEVGSTASAPADISTTAIDLARVGDEVVKTANKTVAARGDIITYTVSTIDNATGHDVDYTFRDVLPEGVTLIQSSLPAGATYDAGTRTITYAATSEYFAPHYTVSTNANNPYCTNVFGGSGYFDAKTELGWSSSTSLSGDEIFWSYSNGAVGGKMNYYGSPIAGNPYFTDDGYALMIPSVTAANFSATPQNIPDPASPNGMYALWNDMVIVADAATNKGVTAGGVAGTSGFFFIEFDDVQPKSDPTSSIDYEYMANNYVDPDFPEIMFAFDNITGSFDWDTNALVGLENLDGTIGDKFTGTLSDDLVVCFDLTYPRLEFSYRVTVDADYPLATPLVNMLYNDTGELNTTEESTSNTITVSDFSLRMPLISKQ